MNDENLPSRFDLGNLEMKSKMGVEKFNDVKERKKLCGWFFFRPSYIQKFRTPKWALFWLCWAAAVQGMIVNGFIYVIITTIEKRFGFKSFETGLIAGSYDLAGFLFLVPVSYLGGRSNASKPKFIGIGLLILGVGSLLFASPHYFAGTYKSSESAESLCHVNQTAKMTDRDPNDSEVEPNRVLYLAIFLIAQFLHGAGATPLYTLGITFIDENVSKKMSSLYLGIYYTMSIIGPALGYVVGGEILKLHTDFIGVDSGSIEMTVRSNTWIGAWWIGFVAGAILCFAIAFPILAFPATLPGSEELKKEKVSEAHGKSEKSSGETYSKLRELPRAVKELLSNPAFFVLNLAGSCDGLLIAGFSAFLPKLIENQFSVSASWAAVLMGLITVPAGGLGTFLGGYLVKRWNLSCSGIIKFCTVVTGICTLFFTSFAIKCPNLDFAGLTVPHHENANLPSEALFLDNICNTGCECSKSNFEPICGTNGITYFSPCFAGCQEEAAVDNMKVYQDCKCIQGMAANTTSIDKVISYKATNTTCDSKCTYMWLFLVLLFFNMLFTFMTTMPLISATLRVVRDEQRSFALGIHWLKIRILGMVPAPLIFGFLIDGTCILWNGSGEEKGLCLVYNNSDMSTYLLILAVIVKCASLLFFFLAWCCYVPSGTKQTSESEQQSVAMNSCSESGSVTHL